MEWERLLSKKTQVKREKDSKYFDYYPIGEFEKDYKSIISSAAFRRLQDKTQVFPLDKSDFVRTRLTHSIEVSTIAKQLGIMLIQGTKKYSDEFYKDAEENANIIKDIPSVLSCAGLLHDLGNPPFGHFGEVVIRDWFIEEFKKDSFCFKGKPIRDLLSERMKKDLCNFEGNAQALRILSKVKNNPTGYDSNLTYSVLNALIKYPTNSEQIDSKSDNIKFHKLGYFYAEEDIFNTICKETGTKIDNNNFVRHPLTFLVEAADDIAYATADLEDAIKKEKFTVDEFISYFNSELDNQNCENKKNKSRELIQNLENRINKIQKRTKESDLIVFQKWSEYAKQWLMYVVVYSFVTNYKEIIKGNYKKDLFNDGFHKQSIKILKGSMIKFVFNSPDILKLELSAKKIVSSLLTDFIYAVIHWDIHDDEYPLIKAHKKLIDIISENHRNDYQNARGDDESENLYLRFLMVTDYISGMTDSFAKNLYQELNGIS